MIACVGCFQLILGLSGSILYQVSHNIFHKWNIRCDKKSKLLYHECKAQYCRLLYRSSMYRYKSTILYQHIPNSHDKIESSSVKWTGALQVGSLVEICCKIFLIHLDSSKDYRVLQIQHSTEGICLVNLLLGTTLSPQKGCDRIPPI